MELTGKDFKRYSKNDWIDLIGNSLKNIQTDDIRWEVFPGLMANPFAAGEDLVSISTAEFVSTALSDDWETGLIIDRPEMYVLAEEQGANAVWLNLSSEEWSGNAKSLFDLAVKWYLPWSFGDDTAYFLKTKKMSSDHAQISQVAWISHDLSVISFSDIKKRFQSGPPGFDLIIKLADSENELQKAGSVIKFIKDFTEWVDREQIEYHEFEWLIQHLGLMVPVGNQMLFEAALLRSIQSIWFNVLKAYHIPFNKLRIIALVDNAQNSSNPNDQLILNSISTVGAAIGGADTIFVNTDPDAENRLESQVLNKNIQLICKHEAGLNRVTDAIAGSYALEDLTARLVLYIWKNI